MLWLEAGVKVILFEGVIENSSHVEVVIVRELPSTSCPFNVTLATLQLDGECHGRRVSRDTQRRRRAA